MTLRLSVVVVHRVMWSKKKVHRTIVYFVVLKMDGFLRSKSIHNTITFLFESER